MDNLEYIAKQLVETIKMARADERAFLVYLLEMALAEADDEIRHRHYDEQT